MYEHEVRKIIDEARERLQSRHEECTTCKHKGEEHGMNCLECCPVDRKLKENNNAR